jgi:hypothetical protein
MKEKTYRPSNKFARTKLSFALISRDGRGISARVYKPYHIEDDLTTDFSLGQLRYGFSNTVGSTDYTIYRKFSRNSIEREPLYHLEFDSEKDVTRVKSKVSIKPDIATAGSTKSAKRLCERLLRDELKGVKTFWRKK